MKYSKLTVLIKTDKVVHYFIGSQLRGALGYALKNVTCINPSFKCDGCFASSDCLYYEFYEEKNNIHKYRFDFELGKKYYEFSFYLFDDASSKLPYIVSAINMMLTKNGLGKDRVVYKDFDMYVNDFSCIQDKKINLPQNFIKTFQIDNICQDITLKFLTPLRMKKNNRFIRGENLDLKDIVSSIYQRQMRLLDQGYKKFPYEIKGEITHKDLHYKELTRLSNRQKTTMKLGGIMGSIDIKGLNKESYEVLKLGELIGVAKQCVFGLGKIEVETING